MPDASDYNPLTDPLTSPAAGLGTTAPQAGLFPGLSPDFARKAMMHESQGQNIPNAAGGAAQGYYQIMPSTWAAIRQQNPSLPPDVKDATYAQQTQGYNSLVRNNAASLKAAGLPVNDSNVFMASFLGAGGATKFLHSMQQNPRAPAAALFPQEAKANPQVFTPGATLGDVYSKMTKSFGGGPTVVASAPGQEAQPALTAPSASQLTGAAAAPSQSPLTGLMTLAALQRAFPQHQFQPVDYNPAALVPKVGS